MSKNPNPAASPALEPVSISPETAVTLSGFSLATIYRLLAAKAFRARRSQSGARTLIDYASFKAYLKSLPDYVPGASLPNSPQMNRKRR